MLTDNAARGRTEREGGAFRIMLWPPPVWLFLQPQATGRHQGHLGATLLKYEMREDVALSEQPWHLTTARSSKRRISRQSKLTGAGICLCHPLIDAPLPIYTSALALTPINYLASLSQGKHSAQGESSTPNQLVLRLPLNTFLILRQWEDRQAAHSNQLLSGCPRLGVF
ncbi:hypothetical protein AMECASPLE_000042 [Ameca splendens]|uniref:Uncharacterized protein n=1 Tax=Ameca splendens TaxID=208324 RepID=A0ABV0X9J2_9TELE